MSQPPAIPPLPSLPDTLGSEFPIVEICDVGAMSEGDERFAELLKLKLANVTGFEPNPNELAKLTAKNQPRRKYLPYFLGRGGPATFHLARYPGCSSLLEPDPAVIDLFLSIGATLPNGNFAVIKTEPVQTVRLDDVPEISQPIDYLKLDVQGGELDVLTGATRTLGDCLVIESEVEFVPLYKNQPLFGDVQVFLRQHGFALHKLIDVAGRALRSFSLINNPFAAVSQLLWSDAIFVRDFSKLDQFTDEQLLKSSLILYQVYRSYDLVSHLLTEYDRRRGTQFTGKFIQMLTRQGRIPLMFLNQKLHA